MASPAATGKGKYGDVSWGGLAHLATVLARFPLAALWFCGKSALFRRNSFRRTTFVALMKWMTEKLPDVGQVQYMMPKSVDTYKAWAAANSMPITVEALADDTSIMWIGPKRTDRVILYFHGGGYYSPIFSPGISFLHHVQKELTKDGCDVGLAILGYSLIPTAFYPTQIRQAMLATEHIIASGVHPSNLHLMGDSAGGNLILGLLSHMLHPLDALRPMISPKAPIRSVYLMSPWVCLQSTADSLVNDTHEDMVSGVGINRVGALFMSAVPADQRAYVEPMHAPDDWFAGLDSVVERMLVTAGGAEVLRDDIMQLSQTFGRVKSEYTLVLQPGGYHDDPILDFMAVVPLDKLGTLTPTIVQWLAAAIKSSN